MTHYLKIIFILHGLFLFNTSLAVSGHGTEVSNLPEQINLSKKSVWRLVSLNEKERNTIATGFFISPTRFVTNFFALKQRLKLYDLDDLAITTGLSLGDMFTNAIENRNPVENQQNFKIKSIQKISIVNDLAILEIDGEVKNYLSLKNTPPTPRENLFLAGYPEREFKIINKIDWLVLNEKNYYVMEVNENYDFHNHDMIGVRGSPVLNKEGEVAGVMSQGLDNQWTVIRTEVLQNLLQEKIKTFSTPFKGIMEEEINNLQKMAEQGKALAQYRLGMYYLYDGTWLFIDYKKALYWLTKAGEQGEIKAQDKLWRVYYHGKIISKDHVKSNYWGNKMREKLEDAKDHNLAEELRAVIRKGK